MVLQQRLKEEHIHYNDINYDRCTYLAKFPIIWK